MASRPAASILIAQVWRRTWGVTFRLTKLGHAPAATALWSLTRWATASVVILLLVPRAAKRGSVSNPTFSLTQTRRIFAVSESSGVIRSFRPLP